MNAQVLLIDDSQTDAAFIIDILEREGYQTQHAKSGNAGLELAKNHLPDLILLDVIMPEIDGFDTCRRLMQEHRLQHIPVIFLTAREDSGSIYKGLNAGAVDFITKPFDAQELLLRIKIHIQKQQVQNELQDALQESEKKFKVMLDYTYSAEFFRNENGELVYVSPGFERVFGYNREEYQKGNIQLGDFVHPHDIAITQEQFLKSQQGKTVVNFVFRIIKPDSSVAWLAVSSQPVYDNAGNYLGNRSSIRDITPQKQAEMELKKSRESFRSLVINSSDWIWAVDKDGIYTFSSPQVEEILGWKPHEVIGHAVFEFMPGAEQQRINDFFQHKKTAKEGFKGLINIAYHKNGEKVYLETNAVPVFDQNNELAGYQGVDRDITERCMAEQKLKKQYHEIQQKDQALKQNIALIKEKNKQLRQEKTHLRMIFENVTEALITADAQGFIKSFNPSAENLFGYQAAQVIGKNLEFLLPDHAFTINDKATGDTANTQMRQLVGSRREIRAQKKSDDVFPAELHVAGALLDDEQRFIISLSDITKRKEAEKALRDSEEKLRQLAENVSEVFWLRTRDQILYINPAYERIWGRSRDILYKDSMDFQKAILPEDQHRIKQAINRLFMHNTPMHEEFRIQKPNGEVRWIRTLSVRISSSKTHEKRFAGAASDITELKETQEQLLKAKEKAESANQAKTTFLSNISHEIKTPLNSILGFVDVLYEKGGRELYSYIQKIHESGKRLQELFTDVLTLAEHEKQNIKIHPVPARPVSLLRETVNTLPITIPQEQRALNIHESKAIPAFLMLDGERFKQIIRNLLSNALKFTKKGSIDVTLEAIPAGHNAVDLHLQVADTGMGIPEDFLPRLYTPFLQQQEKLERNYQGAGLGLAVTKTIVEQMNGSISVESTQGKGTTFSVVLKQVEIATPAASETFSEAEAPKDASPERASSQFEEFKLPEDVKEKLPEIIADLEATPREIWNKLQKNQAISEVREFLNAVEQTGQTYNVEVLRMYSEELRQSCDTFDIVNINNKLEQFPRLIKRMKQEGS